MYYHLIKKRNSYREAYPVYEWLAGTLVGSQSYESLKDSIASASRLF